MLDSCCIEVGVTASGASIGLVPIQFYRRSEAMAMEEQLALIKDPNHSELLLGVIRNVTKLEPLVRDRVRTPFIDRPEILDQTILMPFTSANVRLYASLDTSSRTMREVRHAPTPGSRVYVIRDGSFLSEYIRTQNPITVGSHKYSNWSVILDAAYINHHVGVFGATGMGKSRLVKVLVEELVRVGRRVIIFDHSGVDYSNLRGKLISSKEITISPPTIASVIAQRARLSWQTFGEYLEVATITYLRERQALKGSLAPGAAVGRWDKSAFLKHLVDTMKKLNARESTIEKAKLFIDYFIGSEFFEELNRRTIAPTDVVKLSEDEPVVIDLSPDPELPVKQAIVADVMQAAWDLVKSTRSSIGLTFVIDEAQNYVPENEWTICGDIVETTVREGRKWGLSIILASQRMSRDIRASVRANLGTVFFSRLSAQGDLREIAAYMDLADVSESTLAQLSPREFFVAGLMNPVRKPLLIRVRES